MRPGPLLLIAPCILVSPCAIGQDYSTPDQYGFTVESDLVYGIAANYLGVADTLRLDIYKPIGNPDTQRPLVVCAHGGSWLAGCKDEPNGIVQLAQQFVKRGYVVASINYRLGWHKDDYVSDPVAGYPPSLWPEAYRALYAADTLEIMRAIYRGMQDMKGAIRYMKERAPQDSVCVEKVFVAGESAGAFIALATAFLDRDAEKPASCAALPDAPAPYFKCANLTALECVVREWEVDAPMRARPDLGPVEGILNLNGSDARVRGVAAFYGGVPLDALALDWMQGPDTPSVYLYHQTCDGVVLSGAGRPYATISTHCNLGATPWHHGLPIMVGSAGLQQLFSTLDAPPPLLADLQPCDAFNPGLALFECARYGDNGSYHYTANLPLRAANLSGWWAAIATDPDACLSTGQGERSASLPLAYPQPASTLLHVPDWAGEPIRILDAAGRTVARMRVQGEAVDVSGLSPGIYLLRRERDGLALRALVHR
ncbi:MAG: alpha/beta hydrolase fold domain-containing protein [Flavobacteriales bacterium]|nr:MAG: alpha/beta hydrolase fold domain-containing protein [Flavobacteriales bacterium]